jgi:hypothetical protein
MFATHKGKFLELPGVNGAGPDSASLCLKVSESSSTPAQAWASAKTGGPGRFRFKELVSGTLPVVVEIGCGVLCPARALSLWPFWRNSAVAP